MKKRRLLGEKGKSRKGFDEKKYSKKRASSCKKKKKGGPEKGSPAEKNYCDDCTTKGLWERFQKKREID